MTANNENIGVSPVALFVYNRPEHTKKTLASINNTILVEQTDLFIFSDAPKNGKSIDSVNDVRKLIEEFKNNDSHFKTCTIIYADKNKGLAQSIIEGTTKIINQFGKIVVLEDDLSVSRDFLVYMNDALDFYERKSNIWAISGYSFPMKCLVDYPHDVFLTGRANSWGWATWKDRWDTVDWDVIDYDKKIKYNLYNRIKFGKWGADMPIMLDANRYGYNNSWAIRWDYAASCQNRYTVYPKESRIENHGTDGSGTHFGKENHKYDTLLNDKNTKCNFEDVEPSEKIRKEFRRKYISFLGSIKWNVIWIYRKAINKYKV